MMADSPRITVLDGGLTVITERLEHIRSVALGVNFRVGSRDDPVEQAGTAHAIEHMVFKGTADRDAIAINIAAESHGAELNAFTDKESTCFYGRFPGDQSAAVTALLCEIVTSPAFSQAELVKEKQVISEEIRTANEDPDSTAVNLMFQSAYGAHPMGRQIAGTLESVERIDEGDLRGFYRRHYGPGCGVAVAVGDVDHDRVVAALAPLLGHHDPCIPVARAAPEPGPAAVKVETRRDLSQVYVSLSRPALTYADPRRHALFVLNTALGGGMSSRLFQRLREREALVYSVASFTELYGDSGLLGIYFVTDHRKLERCLDVMREELRLLRAHGLTADEFERARNMTKSSVLLALESPTSRMLRLARTYQLLGRVVTVDETVDGLNRLERKGVAVLIEELLDDGFRHAGAVGPLHEAEFGRLLAANS
jgi:predicted Zn-dependent peptidase